MDLSEAMEPVFQTERFDVFLVTCARNRALGLPRDVYLAFHRQQDIPRPVCICTVWCKCPINGLPYVEWIEVTSNDRRTGIASEVLLGVQDFIGPMIADPVTHAGEKLVEALGDQLIDVPFEMDRKYASGRIEDDAFTHELEQEKQDAAHIEATQAIARSMPPGVDLECAGDE